MERKASSPMAPTFLVSAPGKVIVFGEHAAVHGQPAIAAAISLRSYLLVNTLSKSRRTVRLSFRDIGLDHTWDIDTLPWAAFNQPGRRRIYSSPATSLDPVLLAAVKPHVEAAVSPRLSDRERRMHTGSATAFLYLFLSLGSRQSHPAIYTLRSTIPVGAGLGSSASVCVCLSTALLLQTRALSGPHADHQQQQPPEEAKMQIERVNAWAFVGELCIHGRRPSGVDNTVSAYGNATVFRRAHDGGGGGPPTITPLSASFPKLPLLLVDTQQPRSTAEQVERVRMLAEEQPTITESILTTIGQLTTSALEVMSSSSFDSEDDMAIEGLGTLFRVNHGLLVSLGVSHPRLERVRELVDSAGIGWAKLTGAGGGGCAITLFRPTTKDEEMSVLENTLHTEGFRVYKTILGANGVGVLWPAVFHHDSVGGKPGEEINQEKFEKAVGPEGVEQLVGVGVQEKRQGWKFWACTAV
ncbi:GHMP kinase [Bombardia bombarda]|uniref:Mevalonate kinase n=1 Tax=Bombardia bombarda TaxID=252184 RepID=A0AA39W3Q3_9PEZI|nr:GHMP kinase [Bombardia bombarda]